MVPRVKQLVSFQLFQLERDFFCTGGRMDYKKIIATAVNQAADAALTEEEIYRLLEVPK